MILYTRIQEIK